RKHLRLPIAERWFPEPVRLEKSAGMHRFVWDLRYASSGATDAEDASDESTVPKGPRVQPGVYHLKLTVDGQAQTQSIAVKMDPRSSATAAGLADQYRDAIEIYQSTMLSRQSLSEVKSVQKQLDNISAQAASNPELLARVTVLHGALQKILDGEKGSATMGLNSANSGIASALKVVEGGDRSIPESALEVYRISKAAFEVRAAEWQRLKTSDLVQLNHELENSGLAPVKMAEIEQEIEYLMTR
ncbi:MAG TPA: hypothetical protein VG897_05615, partial [Terriglobales bacterium]|nr:hypothetical protein [Terriglobales bacterium]